MTIAILIVQVIVALVQAAFLILGLLLLAGIIRNGETINEQARAQAAMDEALANEATHQTRNNDPWADRWPPWGASGTENTTN